MTELEIWSKELWVGWKEILSAIECSMGSARKAMREDELPIKYPFGRPTLSKTDYLMWLRTRPIGMPIKTSPSPVK